MIEAAAVSIGLATVAWLGPLFVVAGAIAAVFSLYLLLVAVTAFLYAPYRGQSGVQVPPRSRIVVLVPAHDEARLIGRCVRSLRAQTYPGQLVEILVIADNCTDDTAAIARRAGAEALVRNQPDARGKGQALRWAIDLLARQRRFDAVVVVDADSVADPAFLSGLVRRFEGGADVVQGESLLFEDGSPQAALRAAAFLLVNRVRPAGRAVLGLPCGLAGNGMLFGRGVLAAHPWDAFTSAEDLEFSIRLRQAGIGPAFAGGAILRSPTAPNARSAEQQQLRWEGGKLHLIRTKVPGLIGQALRDRRLSLLDAAFELALPPLSLLAAYSGVGVSVGGLLVWNDLVAPWALIPFWVAIVSIPLFVLVGLAAARAPSSSYRAMLRAPLLVLVKTWRLYRLFTFRPDTWVRTERQGNRPDEAVDAKPAGKQP